MPGIIVYIKPHFEKDSIPIELNVDNDVTFIVTALRGPDYCNLLSKIFGAAIIRGYIDEWAYGVDFDPYSLYGYIKHNLPKFNNSNQFAREQFNHLRIGLTSHYADHIMKAFDVLINVFLENEYYHDAIFCDLITTLWHHAYEEKINSFIRSFDELLDFLAIMLNRDNDDNSRTETRD